MKKSKFKEIFLFRCYYWPCFHAAADALSYCPCENMSRNCIQSLRETPWQQTSRAEIENLTHVFINYLFSTAV